MVPSQRIEASFDLVQIQKSQLCSVNKLDRSLVDQEEFEQLVNESEILSLAHEIGMAFQKSVGNKF